MGSPLAAWLPLINLVLVRVSFYACKETPACSQACISATLNLMTMLGRVPGAKRLPNCGTVAWSSWPRKNN